MIPLEDQWKDGKVTAEVRRELQRVLAGQRAWRKLNPDIVPTFKEPAGYLQDAKPEWKKCVIVAAVLISRPDERVTVIRETFNWL